MTGPITFANDTARSHLLMRGYVYTYRDADRTTGTTWARWRRGGPGKLDVEVERETVVEDSSELTRYATGSGFRFPGAWEAAIKREHGVDDVEGGAIYRVDLLDWRVDR